jgi:hypothetical protein
MKDLPLQNIVTNIVVPHIHPHASGVMASADLCCPVQQR